MLDRAQHLKLFLIGSGDSRKDAEAVVSDKWVREELDRHPLNPKRLLWVMRRVSDFRVQENEFLHLFGRYR
jgi:hypothetical protein